jgi:Ca2+-binding RTX toxin-like protein
VRGTAFDDELLGGGAGRTATGNPVEVFSGGAGNDTINGKGGWDVAVYGSSPNAINVNLTLTTGNVQDGWGFTDTVTNIEEFTGSYYNDTFLGNSADQTFNGSEGNDTMDGGSGYDEVGFNNDDAGVTVRLGGWVGSIMVGLPDGYTGSAMDGWGNFDVFRNIEGVEGSGFGDLIYGDANNNRLDGRGGADTIDGGDGVDWVEYNQAMVGISVDLSLGIALDDGQGIDSAAQSAAVEQDKLMNIENVLGGYGNDLIVGSSIANELDGGEGNDSLDGGNGDDTLTGGSGNDTIEGGAGSDTAKFTGPRSGYIIALANGSMTVTDITSNRDGSDQLTNTESLSFSDCTISLLTTETSGISVTGTVGNQSLDGGTGFDILDGGAGIDTLSGGAGNDQYLVDTDTDTIIESVDGGIDTVISSFTQTNSLADNVENLTLTGTAAINATGNTLPNRLVGNSGNNLLTGGAGNDTLTGGNGADTLTGGQGNDTLILTETTLASALDVVIFAGGSGTAGNTARVSSLGVDTITGIDLGTNTSAVDKLQFSAADFAITGIALLGTTSSDGNFYIVTAAPSSSPVDLNGTNGANTRAIVFVGATSGSEGVQVYYTINEGSFSSNSGNAVLIATLTGINTSTLNASDLEFIA